MLSIAEGAVLISSPLQAAGPVLADGSDSVAVFAVFFPFLVLVAVPIAVYGFLYQRYRNSKRRFTFEKEAHIMVGNLRTHDRQVSRKNRQTSSSMVGDNSGNPTMRVNRIRVQ